MDAIVEAALRKWPNVPHCFGWLALDARGDWYMRDDRVQAAGAFPSVKGSRIEHPKLIDFIGRNYAADADGAWYFQNGPQRVYVELEASPWVWRLQADGEAMAMVTHTGRPAVAQETMLDERGRLFVAADLGLGLVHTLDIEISADAIERSHWPPARETTFERLVAHYAYRLSPAAAPGRGGAREATSPR